MACRAGNSSADNVAYLVDNKLRPAGLLATAEHAAPLPHAAPLLGLRLRFGLVPERAHRAATTALRPLFRPAVVIAALVGLVVLDGWLVLARAEVAEAGRRVLYQPQLLLLLTALTIASAVFHETGHATAARYGGATPGVMGAGVYLVWPVFYTDVTDSYRLDRRGRLRTDLGGVYFNVLFTLATAGVYFGTRYSPLLVFLVLAQLETLQQFLPFVRLDGYYVVSDLVGVPNLFVYMAPVLVLATRRAGPAQRRAAEAKLAALKPWGRRVIRAWVFLTTPILLVNLLVFVVVAPAVAGAAWGSGRVQLDAIGAASGSGHVVGVMNVLVGLGVLCAPLVGMAYIAVLGLTRLARPVQRWIRRRPVAAAIAAVVLAAALAGQLGVVWPHTFETALRQSEVSPAATPVARAGAIAPPSTEPRATPSTTPAPAPAPPPTATPTSAASAVPPATCGARSPDGGPAGGRQLWLEQLLCETQT